MTQIPDAMPVGYRLLIDHMDTTLYYRDMVVAHGTVEDCRYALQKNFRNMNKGDLIKLAYTEDEARSVDTAIPFHLWDSCNVGWCVYDYNGSALGTLVDLWDMVPDWVRWIGREWREDN